MKLTQSKDVQQALDKMNIHNYEDIILHLPRTYQDFHLSDENKLEDKKKIVVECKMVSSPVLIKHNHLSIVRFSIVSSQNKFYIVVAYNRPYLCGQLALGEQLTILGSYDLAKKCINLEQVVKGIILEEEKLKPIYSLSEPMKNFQMVRLVKKAFEHLQNIDDIIPLSLREKYRLINKREALYKAHFPCSYEDIKQAYRTLKYEECLLFTLKTKWIRAQNKALKWEKKKKIPVKEINDLVKVLPYKLTSDQKKAIQEIVYDMNDNTLMYRLMQGDVGSGKTVVAALAFYANKLRGDQGAFMAPTDALARQHYQTFQELFKSFNLNIELLVGSLTIKEKQEIKKQLIEGKIDILIGTHALFSEDVIYHSLGLVVIDEQHRFGVNQRTLLASKGERADLLLMSATPIPRTLALSIYGDLDVTTIQNFPFSKRKVTTTVVQEKADIIQIRIKEALSGHQQVYVIAPLIESNDQSTSVENLYQKYQNEYPGLVSLLHGKMTVEEKEEALELFKSGIKPILVSTTVVEVGIDVKTASVMIIYSASQFGLASLHQLRGRIGRNGQEAYCFLLFNEEDENEYEKLKILEKTDDGFVVAEEDLRLRGPGEFIGYRQSGLPSFRYLNFIQDLRMIEAATHDAETILKDSQKDDYQIILKTMKEQLEK